MVSAVPQVDISTNGASSRKFVDIELRLLDADAKAKENLNREADQRYWLRWAAVAVAFAIILGMGYMLGHVGYYILSRHGIGAPAAFLVAVYVAPIVSMTTIALALLVAAFRAFKSGDEQASASALAQGAKATGLMN